MKKKGKEKYDRTKNFYFDMCISYLLTCVFQLLYNPHMNQVISGCIEGILKVP